MRIGFQWRIFVVGLTSPAWLFLAFSCPATSLAEPPVTKAEPGDDSSISRIDYLREVKPILRRHCQDCHGANKQRGNLRLDTAQALRVGGDSGPAIVPGHVEESLLIEVVTAEDGADRMPFNRPPLSAEEIDILRRWVVQGAPAPSAEQPEKPGTSLHWSFVPPSKPPLPRAGTASSPRNPIDAFLLADLGRDGLSATPEADKVTLLRRLSLDLIGLPPTIEEVDAFLADSRPDAYEQQVERLLRSPHFGERWARHWLDAARYADSNGFNIDAPRSIWKYRDWVINALNRDQPFDQFVIDQVAGDLRDNPTVDQCIATGFHRNTLINQEGGIDLEQFRVESIVDRVNTTGTVFLGLTIGCAQCHDHKYDPISQREYYQLFAFYNDCDEPDLELASPMEQVFRDALQDETTAFLETAFDLIPDRAAKQAAWEKSTNLAFRQAQTLEARVAFDLAKEQRERQHDLILFDLFLQHGKPDPKLSAAYLSLKKSMPKFVTTMVLSQRSKPRPSTVHIQGDFTRKGDPVEPGTPRVLPAPRPSPGKTRLDRMDLARWLVDPRNPLTARVLVNRLWQVYFGKGIVDTENDFGTQGAPPSHPALLDWLACEFVDQGWSLKALHRIIVTSAAYRRSSRVRPELLARDPDNRGLARQNRLRLEAELIRDSALFAAGLLDPTIGGPSVFPPQPDGVMTLGQMKREWTPSDGPGRYRRGLYTFFWRATPHPSLIVFDAPDSTKACTRRNRSNTPLQALTLLNDESFHEAAQAMARRVLRETSSADPTNRLHHAFRLAVARSPDHLEAARLMTLLSEARRETSTTTSSGDPELLAWTAVCRTLLSLDEFLTRE